MSILSCGGLKPNCMRHKIKWGTMVYKGHIRLARHISSKAVYRFVMNSVSNLLLSTYDCRFISQECSYKFIDTSELCQGEIHKILWTCMDLKAHVRNNQSHRKVYIPFFVIC